MPVECGSFMPMDETVAKALADILAVHSQNAASVQARAFTTDYANEIMHTHNSVVLVLNQEVRPTSGSRYKHGRLRKRRWLIERAGNIQETINACLWASLFENDEFKFENIQAVMILLNGTLKYWFIGACLLAPLRHMNLALHLTFEMWMMKREPVAFDERFFCGCQWVD